MLSANVYNKNTEKYRGNQEHTIQQLGIFAELVARHILDNNDGVKYEAAPLIDEKPVVEKLDDTTYICSSDSDYAHIMKMKEVA